MSPTADRPRRWTPPLVMRVLLVLGFLLAIAATVLVVFSEQVRWLRFAVLLALWAALIAAFAVARSRRGARSADQRAEDSKCTYELELHREIKGDREDAEVRHRHELAGLREQLDRLTATLSGLLDGDLLFERLTLSAESTRVRKVGDAGRTGWVQTAGSDQIEGAGEPGRPFVGTRPVAPSQPGDQIADSRTEVTGSSAKPDVAGAGHSSGIPVADLIAAYGGGPGAPRRRRRADD